MTVKGQVLISVEFADYPAIGVLDRHVAQTGNNEQGCNGLSHLLASIAGGGLESLVQVQVFDENGVAAGAELIVTQANADDGDTVTIAGVVFTRQANPSTVPADGEFAGSTDDTTAAEELAAAIGVHPSLKGVALVSDVVAGTVSLKCTSLGLQGNGLTLESSDATFIGPSGTHFTGGAAGGEVSELRGYKQGL